MADRTSRPGRMSSVHTPATRRSARRRLGERFPRAIEDQQLLLDENGLGHHGPGTAGAGEPGDRRHQMKKQDGQVAHGPHRNRLAEILEMLRNLEFAMHT